MNLYSYGYLMNSSSIITDVFIFLAIVLGISFLVFGIKYLHNRTNLRYRNVLIVVVAFAALLICIQINRFQTQRSNNSQVGQTVQVMKDISAKKHISLKHVYSSSTNFTSGMLVKAGRKFYTVNANTTNTAYQLVKSRPMSNELRYIHHNKWYNFNWSFNSNNNQYWDVALKFLIGFILFIVQINWTGKNNLAPSNAVDQIENYVLGGIVGGIIYNPAITLMQFIIIILIWSVIVFSSRVLTDRSDIIHDFIQGSPQVIINHGHIDVDTALRNGLSASDIVFKLRAAGISNYQDIRRVILEQNGQFSIDSIHNKDANYPIIEDGKINSNMLKQMHHTHRWLRDLLKLKHHNLRNVFLGQISDGQLILTLYPRTKHRFTKFSPKYQISLKHAKHYIEKRLEFHRKNHQNRHNHKNHKKNGKH